MTEIIKKRIDQLNSNDVPAGYKKTELGIFPCDWKVTNIGEICDIYSGGTPSTKKSEYWNGDIPWCSPTDITKSDKYITKTEKYISKQGLNNSSAVLMPVNSILMCSRATIGPKCINKVPMATNQGFKNLVCKNPKDTEYVYYLLDNLVLRFIKASNGSTFLELSKSELEKARCCIPKTEYERTLIAKIITKWDKAIELYNKQIELLKQYKSICLKKMFPAKGENVPEWRFKGFTDAWEQRKVSDIANRFDNLRVPVAANLRIPGSTPFYGANGIQDYVDGFTHEGEFVLVAEDGANDLKNYPVKCVNGRIWVNNHAHVLQSKPNIAENQFLAFSISQADVESLLVGGGRAKLNAEVMMGIDLIIPGLQEQIAIGKYLQQLDDLITLHQRKLEKTENQRKVLQQYLLNGIVRVNI